MKKITELMVELSKDTYSENAYVVECSQMYLGLLCKFINENGINFNAKQEQGYIGIYKDLKMYEKIEI